jgi:hypothetical protein
MTACLRFTRRVSLVHTSWVISTLTLEQVWNSFVDNGGMFSQLAFVLLFGVQPDQVTMHGASPTYVDSSWVKSKQIRPQKQLNILNARPGVVEASLRIEPYNGESHILAYLHSSPATSASKVNRVGVRL